MPFLLLFFFAFFFVLVLALFIVLLFVLCFRSPARICPKRSSASSPPSSNAGVFFGLEREGAPERESPLDAVPDATPPNGGAFDKKDIQHDS